ncbi:AMP-dependent synthetase/ligase [Penicillium expansum]|uniref:AMP-dependent synthetase/ligase n=1 Tax=Penicillium expansum TaxID=27334 RepID=A0A0A2KDD9_PENEN|nr:AMP-dependent synthetase/ligase [Penicillium expansum]KGO46862.1 AMP-dependent synthetase/ligase [Penicillium expansum]KGO62370.1 AMP-dependent synthetase/ligase [Penicillium expansum]
MAPVLLEPTLVASQPSTAPLKVAVNGTATNGVGFTLKARPWRLLHLADVLNPPPLTQEEHPDIRIQRLLQLAWVTTIRAFSCSTTLYIGQDYLKGQCYIGEAAHGYSKPTVQIHVDPHDTVGDLFRESIEALGPLSHVGVTDNVQISQTEHSGFNVAIVYQKQPAERILSGQDACVGHCQVCCGIPAKEPSEVDLIFTGLRLSIRHTSDDRLHARLDVGNTGIGLPLATSLLNSFNQALSSIDGASTQTIGSLELCSAQDRDQITQFTKDIGPANDALLHDLCLQHVKTTPDAPAVRSWDGDLTYRQLEDLTSRLAHWLVGQGVGPNIYIACAFYKSTWAVVARLAVLMAGGAYICVDGSDPPPYLASVLERTQIKIMLTSAGYKEKFADRVETIFEVSDASVSSLPLVTSIPCSTVKPTDPCVVLFTSGSTGKPKGIIQEHRSYASALTDYIRVMGMGPHSRMFQFDAYTFDISNNDFLAPLMAGGCCCVPTRSLTMDSLMNDMNDLEGNMMFITPSVAIDMEPDRVPTLEMMCIGGEPVSDAVLAKWLDRVQVVNQYGMGEIASMCAYNRNLQMGRGSVVGRPGTGAIWIVNPDNPDQLMPVGGVGELLIEGPHLSKGYLDHVSGKSENFLATPPVWMAQLHTDRPNHRLYRSGDLGRYNHDGTVELMGRKDSMLKLDGARVEAGQVEYVLRRNLSTGDAAVVDILGAIDGEADPILAVYLYLANNPMNMENGPDEEMEFRPISNKHAVHGLTLSLSEAVRQNLPKYYVPALYILIDRVPRTKSKKTDRRKLHMLGQAYYMEHRDELEDITVWLDWNEI